jgi:thymidine phosphorylase
MLCLCRGWEYERSAAEVSQALSGGAALSKFRQWIAAQGGAAEIADDPSLLEAARVQYKYKSQSDGYVYHMDAERIGKAAAALGAGRAKKGDAIDYAAGIVFLKKTGDAVAAGETLAVLHTSDKRRLTDATAYLEDAVAVSGTRPEHAPLIYDVIE